MFSLARCCRRVSFNPSWGPAGTVFLEFGTEDMPPLQPLVGSCWNSERRDDPVGQRLASTPRGVLLEPSTPSTGRARTGRFNPSWGPAGTGQPDVRAAVRRTEASTPRGVLLEPSPLRSSIHESGVLQPLVGSCWNAVRPVRRRSGGDASTPRGVLLELAISCRGLGNTHVSTPRGVLLELCRPLRLCTSHSASTPRGVLLEQTASDG